ncbi:uncharacterized protein AB675_11202 [Cyphellophora attinorum]|uniref:Major facilitator superfamily (MFS) profile domain-containing protein n=1 Tax=Cyphellophora attinorum TaxID=1664694 RepID=A0A0N1HGK9_9EURO|nr:uncharacterized protein AB675_11202 [Phialophora attinorum]KPI34585.1 hypothetical protein AB675_11202 [Phialophora attinorum]
MTSDSAAKAPAEATETTALLGSDSLHAASQRRRVWFEPVHFVLLCGFLVSLSFGITQVPIIYVLRLMTCEVYYQHHAEPPASGHDRCSIPTIEAGTARAVSLLGASTTLFGFINLFLTKWTITKLGVKTALALQVFFPAVRLVVQSISVATGGYAGIVLMQCSQMVTVMGGPNGYMLALNTYVTEVTEHKERTGTLGKLQGCMMFGSAVGYLIGGFLADVWEMATPFHVALVVFLTSTVFVICFLPWFPPRPTTEDKSESSIRRMLGPLRTILPSKWVRPGGSVSTEYGAVFLAAGAFIAVLATGYLPALLQMYATDIFGFGPTRNSYVVATHSFLRGTFLMFAFPRIIKLGRRVMESRAERHASAIQSTTTSGTATPSEQAQLANAMQDEEQEDVMPPKASGEQETFEFDLVYTRASILIDGALTCGAAFIQKGWQMYLLAAVLPFGAGTASAAKGVILQMCPAEDRTDALSAIAIVEMFARLLTTFVFGLIFAAFASIEKTYLVFVCNGAVAFVGFFVLLLSRFPQEGSRRLSNPKTTEADTDDND